MALEDLTGAAKISALVATNPTPDDWADEGDDHIRGIKNVLKNTIGPAAQVLLANNALIGMLMYSHLQDHGPGWLMCDGRILTGAQYPLLWAYAQGAGLVVPYASYGGGQYGMFAYPGDSIANGLRIPDFRGEFIRCWDGGRVIDPDGAARPMGKMQVDALKQHRHDFSDPGHQHWAVDDATHSHVVTDNGPSDLGVPGGGGTNSKIYGSNITGAALTGSSVQDVNLVAWGGIAHATEGRPHNVNLALCIFAGPAA